MRMVTGLGLLVALLSAACSSDPEKDPVTKKCESVCALDAAHACAEQVNACITDCRSFGTKAQAFGGPGCGDCVAGSFKHITDASGKCVGVAHEAELSDACRPSCVTPDGGSGGL